MGSHTPTLPEDHHASDAGVRKRVCKACDRCRLKKSKCDGSLPCSRCKTDNAICVFGERKKSHDKVYPKGYVEMLEQQQAQLVNGIQTLYRRTVNGQGWQGSPLADSGNGHPLTHDILERLGALKHEGHSESEVFEEDVKAIQQRLLSRGEGFMQRAASSNGSESPRSTIFDDASPQVSMRAENLVSVKQAPLTPPDDLPLPFTNQQQNISTQLAPTIHNSTRSSSLNPSSMEQQPWPMAMTDMDESMTLNQYDGLDSFESSFSPSYGGNTMLMNTMTSNCVPNREWAEEDTYQKYFNAMLS